MDALDTMETNRLDTQYSNKVLLEILQVMLSPHPLALSPTMHVMCCVHICIHSVWIVLYVMDTVYVHICLCVLLCTMLTVPAVLSVPPVLPVPAVPQWTHTPSDVLCNLICSVECLVEQCWGVLLCQH